MFEGGVICIEILFFDNEVIVDHILFVFFFIIALNQQNIRTFCFIITPYAILTPGTQAQR